MPIARDYDGISGCVDLPMQRDYFTVRFSDRLVDRVRRPLEQAGSSDIGATFDAIDDWTNEQMCEIV